MGQLQSKSLTSLQMLALNPAEGGAGWVNILLIGGQGWDVRRGTGCLKSFAARWGEPTNETDRERSLFGNEGTTGNWS